ncbi:SusC/RagA family TonB-linked outer membrane protein [Chitinophaga sp. YIM B06452]|uniref:SusC/RagA family TonB-linked outer membrane protein n=1 Tax=Chitinophaga sp. YIM B06452 TaxID=3082158 RepID=UPI0031FE7ADA
MKKTLSVWLLAAISVPGVAQVPSNKADTAGVPRMLDEVAITGYSPATRRQYTGAVSTIPGSAINNIPMASFDQLLQGRAAGLYVASGSGQPGAAARVLIRGQATYGGTVSPLYVVDGIAVESGVFMSMNPADFESVTVLKDANATALYGSRGANGVIVINTKRGKAGDISLRFNTQHGFSQLARNHFDMMSTEERLRFEEEVGQETGRTLGAGWIFSPLNPANASLPASTKSRYAAILDSMRHINTDWQDQFLRRAAPYHEYELSASGGSESIRFYSSAGYLKQEGIVKRSGLERYSFRTNLDVRAKRFSAAINTAVGYTNNSLIESENTSSGPNPIAALYYALPYEAPYVNGVLMHSGNKNQLGGAFDTREGSNAIERMENSTYKVNQLKGMISTDLKYYFTDWLYASSNLGFDYRENVETRTIRPGSFSGSQDGVPGKQGMHREEMIRYYQFTATTGLTFDRTLQEKHRLTVGAFYEFNRIKYSNMAVTGYGITPGLDGTLSGVTPGSALNSFIPQVGGRKTGSALISLVGLARYLYDDKFSLNLSYRRDGSSSLPEKNRWHGFYSVGAGYDLGKESFMEGLSWINTLRVRSSYGSSAAPSAQNFAYASGYGASRYDGAPAIVPTSAGNAEFNWEYTNTFNTGLDIELLNRRIRLVADWYNRSTKGLFLEEQLSQTSGFTSRPINAGTIRNRGVEADLSGDIIRTENLTWTAGFNIAFNKNRVTDLGGTNEFTVGTYILRVGLPVNSHYIVKWGGVDPQTGKAFYYDRDGNPTSSYNVATQSVADFGSTEPRYNGGFYTRLNWKGFSADVFFTYAQDFLRYNAIEVYTLNNNSFAASNQSRRWLDRWRKPGDITDIQSFSDRRNYTSRDLQDASYVRLRNAKLSYNIPEQLLKPTQFLRQATVYLQGQNLLTFTKWDGLDPEDNNGNAFFEYPSPRTITAGVSIQF